MWWTALQHCHMTLVTTSGGNPRPFIRCRTATRLPPVHMYEDKYIHHNFNPSTRLIKTNRRYVAYKPIHIIMYWHNIPEHNSVSRRNSPIPWPVWDLSTNVAATNFMMLECPESFFWKIIGLGKWQVMFWMVTFFWKYYEISSARSDMVGNLLWINRSIPRLTYEIGAK